MTQIKIAYVTNYDPFQLTNWSGTGTYIARALEMQGLTLHYIAINADPRLPTLLARGKNLLAKPFGRTYSVFRSPAVLRNYARQVEAALRRTAADIVFSPGSLPVAYLDCRQPIAFWTDAPFAAMVGFYPEYSRLTHACISEGNQADQFALSRAALAMYSSDWAAQSAIQNYSVQPTKIKVVPFGANVEWGFTLDQIKAFIAARSTDRCNILFIGVDWSRKGGDLVVDVAHRVKAAGVPVQLDIVGCQPPRDLPAFAKVHGFISKANHGGQNALLTLLQQAHFLLLPSKAEAYGVVAVEAASLGVPCIASAVGGIPTIVRQGVSGYCLPQGATPDQYAALILSIFGSAAYRELAISSFTNYKDRLNWRSVGAQVASFLRQL
jgi:glycosyltransferase involved in cell wall biosynthesis